MIPDKLFSKSISEEFSSGRYTEFSSGNFKTECHYEVRNQRMLEMQFFIKYNLNPITSKYSSFKVVIKLNFSAKKHAHRLGLNFMIEARCYQDLNENSSMLKNIIKY